MALFCRLELFFEWEEILQDWYNYWLGSASIILFTFNSATMTWQDFNQLDYESRINMLQEAVCIGQREGGNYTVMLYQLEGFYIEVFHHKKYCYIYVVEAFDDLSRLDIYVEKIRLPENNPH